VSRSAEVIAAARELGETVAKLSFDSPVTHVYNPLQYAWRPHERYLRTHAAGPKKVVFWGMNPGPWGMVQTGVPFGEVAAVRDWMGIDEPVARPAVEHPKRPVLGLDCQRSEVSGRRLWGLFAERFETPAGFFADHLVMNFCPLAFMEEGGRNRTPDKLPAAESRPLFEACAGHMRRVVEILEPEWVVGVGGFAEKKLKEVLDPGTARIGRVLHPSPASPAANRGWARAAAAQLAEQGIWD